MIILFWDFSHQCLLVVFHWSLNDIESPQVTRTLLSILDDLNNAVVWMFFTRRLIFKSSYICTNPSVTVPCVPITIGIIVTFMFHSFFQFSSKVQVLIFIFTFFQFYSVFSRDSQISNLGSSLFCCLSLCLVVWPRFSDPFVCQNPRGDCASHSPGNILGCAYIIYSYGQISINLFGFMAYQPLLVI